MIRRRPPSRISLRRQGHLFACACRQTEALHHLAEQVVGHGTPRDQGGAVALRQSAAEQVKGSQRREPPIGMISQLAAAILKLRTLEKIVPLAMHYLSLSVCCI